MFHRSKSNAFVFIADSSLSQAVLATYTGFVQTFSQTDLNSFLTYSGVAPFNITSMGTSPVAASACTASNYPCSEGNLDTQYIAGIAQGAQSIFWYSNGGSYSSDPWVDILNQILGMHSSSRPSVVSISYGSDETSYPPVYMDAFNNVTRFLSLLGVTVFASSGDEGVTYSAGCLRDSSKSMTRSVFFSMLLYSYNYIIPNIVAGPGPIPGADRATSHSGQLPARTLSP